MSTDLPHLYDLLPPIYRIRDAEQGEPLRALLAVIAEQAAVLEESLDQLYDDQFIETCAPWVVPYIGDLIGYRTLYGIVPKVASPRAEVAHTIAFRRRKGTASMLEQLARDVTGWPARVVEFFQLLATTQHVNHLRRTNHYAPDLRSWERLERLNTPFDPVAHTAEVRRIATGAGRYNIPNIGIFLWRLGAYSLSDSPGFRVDDRRYCFSPLGINTPLFTRPVPEMEITHLAQPVNVPDPISRRVLDRYLASYYGPGLSLALHANGVPVAGVIVCDLSDAAGGLWAHRPDNDVAVDPVLGRIAFPGNQPPPAGVRVTFHYGFSADMGGGEYERADSFEGGLGPLQPVTATIGTALAALGGQGIVEIPGSGRYVETPAVHATASGHVELRAANGRRPTVVLGGDLAITGGADADVTVNGLLITGGILRVPAIPGNTLRRLRLRHCTIVPGLELTTTGDPVHPDQPTLVVEIEDVIVEIDHCIVGGLRVASGAEVRITDSIVDATSETAVAYADPAGSGAGGALHIVDSTVVGKVHARVLRLASNTMFLAGLASGDPWSAPVRAERKQEGCVRFSYLPLSAVVPRRYRCHPQTAADALRVAPHFSSRRYGDPDYMQLAAHAPLEIRNGADDESEMGAFHHLYQPQRETNLRVRLDEYLRFGLEAGIFYVT
jgi:hypothetical protein